MAVGARHGDHVASGAAHGIRPLCHLWESGESGTVVAVHDADVHRCGRHVELQVYALLLGPDPAPLQRLPVQADDKLINSPHSTLIFCKIICNWVLITLQPALEWSHCLQQSATSGQLAKRVRVRHLCIPASTLKTCMGMASSAQMFMNYIFLVVDG